MAAGFWNSDLIKGIEKGKLPTVETDISFDVETIATPRPFNTLGKSFLLLRVAKRCCCVACM